MSVIIPIFHVLLPSNPICYCVQFSTFIEYLQDSVYEKAKRMNSSLDNVAKSLWRLKRPGQTSRRRKQNGLRHTAGRKPTSRGQGGRERKATSRKEKSVSGGSPAPGGTKEALWENLNFWILHTNPNLEEIQTFLCKSFIQGIF